MIRKLAVGVLVPLTIAGAATVAGAQTGRAAKVPTHITIATVGGLAFSSPFKKPNPKGPTKGFPFVATLKFQQASYAIASGGTITFIRHDTTGDPHTLTIVKSSQLPKTAAQVDECIGDAPGTVCGTYGLQMKPIQLAASNTTGGLNGPGDSLAVPPGPASSAAPVTIKVTAPAGTTLDFMCAIHPWMQGAIHVK